MKNWTQTGKHGEMRVVAELIRRGHRPYLPVVDDHGVDVMLSTGVRIQVKTANLSQKNNSCVYKGKRYESVAQHYAFNFGASQTWRNREPIKVKQSIPCSEQCDFFIVFGADEERFWIIPSFLLDGLTGSTITARSGQITLGPKPIPTREMVQTLSQEGRGLKEISSLLGICEVSVWSRKRRESGKGRFAALARLCENRWDFLLVPPVDRDTAIKRITNPTEWIELKKQEKADREVANLEALVKK